MKSNEDLRQYVDEIVERLRKVHETYTSFEAVAANRSISQHIEKLSERESTTFRPPWTNNSWESEIAILRTTIAD